jgi:hypothetical protein
MRDTLLARNLSSERMETAFSRSTITGRALSASYMQGFSVRLTIEELNKRSEAEEESHTWSRARRRTNCMQIVRRGGNAERTVRQAVGLNEATVSMYCICTEYVLCTPYSLCTPYFVCKYRASRNTLYIHLVPRPLPLRLQSRHRNPISRERRIIRRRIRLILQKYVTGILSTVLIEEYYTLYRSTCLQHHRSYPSSSTPSSPTPWPITPA